MSQSLAARAALDRLRPRIGGRSLRDLDKIGAAIALFALVMVFAVFSTSFRQIDNLMLIATSASAIGIVAVGQTIVILTGGVDLSVGAIVAVTGLLSASLMKYGLGPIPPLQGALSYVAIAVGMLVGTSIGAAQGWLIASRRMPPFIVTLGTMVILNGCAAAISYGTVISSLPDEFKWISDGRIGPIPVQALIMLAVFGLASYALHNTKFGRYCYAIGGNETATRLSGVNVDRHKMLVYALSGLLASLSGMLLIAYIDGGAITLGQSYELESIAAVIIGGTSLSGGIGGVWGTLIGVLMITVVPNGMIMLNAPPWSRDIVTGAIILLAVLIDVERQRMRKTKPKLEPGLAPASSGYYLNDVLTRLARTIEEKLASPYCRIYLIDRETSELVPQIMLRAGAEDNGVEDRSGLGRNSIVSEAKESNAPIRIANVARSNGVRVVPMNAKVQSALAVPLEVQERMIGVLEVQSTVPDAFSAEAIELVQAAGDQMAGVLEDAWLLESGWLVRCERDVLRHLWDDHYLSRSDLAEWILDPEETGSRSSLAVQGEALRNLLVATIESLCPPASDDLREAARYGRGYRILQLTYVEEHAVDEIARELHISRRQYFYDLKEALEALADALVHRHQSLLTSVPEQT